jgi:hypothetical protein
MNSGVIVVGDYHMNATPFESAFCRAIQSRLGSPDCPGRCRLFQSLNLAPEKALGGSALFTYNLELNNGANLVQPWPALPDFWIYPAVALETWILLFERG